MRTTNWEALTLESSRDRSLDVDEEPTLVIPLRVAGEGEIGPGVVTY